MIFSTRHGFVTKIKAYSAPMNFRQDTLHRVQIEGALFRVFSNLKITKK
jgi:hypothetical protein